MLVTKTLSDNEQSAGPRRRAAWRGLPGGPLRRSARDRVVAGVAGGIGERFRIDPVIVRLAFVVLSMAGGTGILLYLGWWFSSAEPESSGAEPAPDYDSTLLQTVAVGLMLFGFLLLLREGGIWFGDEWVWPVALAAFGSAVIWSRGSEEGRARWTSRIPGTPAAMFTRDVSPARILLGGILIAGGMAAFLKANDALAAARNLVFAVAVTLTGAGMIFGPAIWRLGRQLTEERRERIRSEERAEVAAHLHDSVLQTLALIQRAESADKMVGLARGQERELRAWLYGRGSAVAGDLLSREFDDAASRIERIHNVVVEVVVVGDCPLDDSLRAAVQACGEAMTNAARHSGAKELSVYVEVEPDSVTAFVRDQGRGFDPSEVPPDRHGIAESIRGRIERHRGTVTIVSAPGEGAEVQITMPRRIEQ